MLTGFRPFRTGDRRRGSRLMGTVPEDLTRMRPPDLSSTGGLHTEEMVLNVGPQHPATHGVLRVLVSVDGERIVRAEPVIGYMHRGHEKLVEQRDFRQITNLLS